MRWRWRIVVCGGQDSLLQAAWARQLFAIVFDVVCETLFAATSMNCDTVFGS
jgi:hypothetical protein